MNYYEHHLGDYAKDTAHLTMIEHGAYRLLLDRYYGSEHGIPMDQAHRVARARTREERAAVDAVLAEFFELRDGLLINRRAQREIEKAQTKIAAARANGKRGGRPRANPEHPPDGTQEKPTGFSPGSVLLTQPKALQTPDTKHQENPPTPRKRGASVHGFPAGFEAFWAAYPRKVAKEAAAKAFARLRPDERLLGLMLAELRRQAASAAWQKDRGEFVPHAATWLNGRRWEDADTPGGSGCADPFAGAL